MFETIVFVIVGMFLFTSPILGFFVENYLRDDDDEIILEEDIVIRKHNENIWF